MAAPAAPAAPDVPDETEEAAPPRKSKKKLFVILGILVVLLGGGGAAAWFLTQGEGESAKEAEAAAPATMPIFVPLETFTVNLQDGDQYLQTDITLQMSDQVQVDALKLHMPRIRSRLLALLSSKHADELIAPEDKALLAQEILTQVKQPFYAQGKPQQVDDVLFTSFVIQ